jgi:hypothetical protein
MYPVLPAEATAKMKTRDLEILQAWVTQFFTAVKNILLLNATTAMPMYCVNIAARKNTKLHLRHMPKILEIPYRKT